MRKMRIQSPCLQVWIFGQERTADPKRPTHPLRRAARRPLRACAQINYGEGDFWLEFCDPWNSDTTALCRTAQSLRRVPSAEVDSFRLRGSALFGRIFSGTLGRCGAVAI